MVKNSVFWYGERPVIKTAPLDRSESAEVLIIGGGLSGLMAALRLSEEKKSVVLVERDFCGAGASGKTSGFITPDSEIELSSLLRTFGKMRAHKIWEFVLSGVAKIKETIVKNGIDCDYEVQDSLFIANNKRGFAHTSEEHEARKTLNYSSTLYGPDTVGSVIGSKGYAGAVRYPDTFGINSFLLCQAIKKILLMRGVRIYEDTRITSIDESGGTTDRGHRIKSVWVLVCTDRFIPDLGVFKKDIYHVQTFLGISAPLAESQVKMMFPEKKLMVWDTDLVYNYFRMTGGNRLLIGGGDVFYTYRGTEATNGERFAKRLARYIKRKFPEIPVTIESVWPGMLGVSKDLLPMMGPDKRFSNVWYVGAATGLPWAAALGTYLAEKVLFGRSDFDTEFSPYRKFVIGKRLQSILQTPPTYALAHGIAKYF